ncbi:MAG: 4Fe-4S dicluster domain-containing protein [Chloroflexi bacterium]|nr:4Fe-4S dicluster domain-containing protein [Chloroflexota bacterium]
MDVYQKLARHLDDLPGGFPPTESGVELRILRRLFTTEEAELALHLLLIPEESQVIAHRAGIAPQEAAQRLDEMAGKGLIYSIESQDRPLKYMALQYVIGIWEFQLNDLDPELIRDMEEYMPALLDETWKVPQLRTIPVGRSIDADLMVLPYEKAKELVQGHERILVAPCICRRERRLVGEGCDKLEESCLVFGNARGLYERNGLGRVIDQQEALDILKRADEAGQVLQPANSKNPSIMCTCCGCCCGVLRNLKLHPKPASLISSPFVAAVDADTCIDCGICEDRCQMDALSLVDGTISLDMDRCIGCGLCVSTCPTGALTLVRKPDVEQPHVPKNILESYARLARARGKLGFADLVRMPLRSVVDRAVVTVKRRKSE